MLPKLIYANTNKESSFYCVASYVHLCSRNSKSLEKCVMKTVEEDIRPRLANGIKEMGIPPLEPLIVPEVSLDTGSTFAAKFKNLHVYYATEFVLKNAYMNLDEDSFKLALHFPRLRITSNYNINGRLLILDLNGSGKSDGNISKIPKFCNLICYNSCKIILF